MSFSGQVKEELSRHMPSARHCQIAEIAALLSMCGRICINERNEYYIKLHTENLTVARKYFYLIQKAFSVICEIKISRHSCKKSYLYEVMVRSAKDSIHILNAVKFFDKEGDIREELSLAQNLVIQNTCCKRAFLRGVFLAAGSVSDPEKSYHLEIAVQVLPKAKQLCEIIKIFDIEARIVKRKKAYIVYLKDSSQIVDFLNVCKAHIALMEFENVRIVKEMRNSINRQVNCETANIGKTIRASVRQIDDICLIKEKKGLESLSENLKEMAELRLNYPDASLKELGNKTNPPIGKSGVNHRLHKLSEIAEEIRGC